MTMSERNGSLVGAEQVWDGDEMMLISNQGTAVRTRVDEVSVQGRNTQGVRVIRTREGEALVSVSRIAEDDVDAAAVNTSDGVIAALPSEAEGVEGNSE
jgi:DNA gyrase subunit A